VAAKAPCQDRDIYLSGPDAMMAKTVQALACRGVPGARIHYDPGVPDG
jgi:ferredoxin-NADP reductase